jgi:hypothetical protein
MKTFSIHGLLISLLLGVTMNQSWIDLVVSRMPVPKTIKAIYDADWEDFEAKEKIFLPDDIKTFVRLYGCGTINRHLTILAPMCKYNNHHTQHTFNLFLHSEDKLNYEDLSSETTQKIRLFPEEDGVYVFAFDSNQKNFGWRVVKINDNWRVISNEIVVFDSWNTYESIPNFADLILDEVSKDSQPSFKPHIM